MAPTLAPTPAGMAVGFEPHCTLSAFRMCHNIRPSRELTVEASIVLAKRSTEYAPGLDTPYWSWLMVDPAHTASALLMTSAPPAQPSAAVSRPSDTIVLAGSRGRYDLYAVTGP